MGNQPQNPESRNNHVNLCPWETAQKGGLSLAKGDVVALRSCQRDVTHQYKQIQNGGTETM